MPDAAYSNPTVYGGDDPLNRTVYGFVHIFFDQKFMGLFSMLFGASVMLLLSKMKEEGRKAVRVHYVRNIWLILLGLAHAILLWEGDVLLIYGLCALFLFFFRNIKPTVQITLGLLIFFIPSIFNVFAANQLSSFSETEIQTLEPYFSSSETEIAEDIAFYRENYADQLASRLSLEDSGLAGETSPAEDIADISLLFEAFARAFGMMLLGMAFYTLGILTAKRSKLFYQRLFAFAGTAGLFAASLGLYLFYANNWNAAYSLFLGRIPNHIATPLLSTAYLALIMLWSKTDAFKRLQDALANVGRMALSNYIGQSLLGTFIFYGFGLGLYGSVNRVGQLGIVLIIWIIQILISAWWLKRFRYGPLEWFWRSLTYFRLEPIRKKPKVLTQHVS